ncbi:hypothetical protein Glove_273g6 [Diversispora epigaea]|uniref:Uncharacterized protein n=1 Tax=Diversispora epigaea TaxID=1348612 RepID=A0A397I3Z2_9GLOM|nr:hypothetical protein Glove_273g6 [Diversispora epigaea]
MCKVYITPSINNFFFPNTHTFLISFIIFVHSSFHGLDNIESSFPLLEVRIKYEAGILGFLHGSSFPFDVNKHLNSFDFITHLFWSEA